MFYGAGTGTVQGWTERKTKNPTRVGVGLGGGDSGGSRPLIELCAHHHCRRSDPCHQTRLPAAMTLAQRFAVARAEKFIGRRDEQSASARQANIFKACRLRRETGLRRAIKCNGVRGREKQASSTLMRVNFACEQRGLPRVFTAQFVPRWIILSLRGHPKDSVHQHGVSGE